MPLAPEDTVDDMAFLQRGWVRFGLGFASVLLIEVFWVLHHRAWHISLPDLGGTVWLVLGIGPFLVGSLAAWLGRWVLTLLLKFLEIVFYGG